MRLHRCFYTVTCCSYLRCAKTIPCANPGMVGVVGPVRSGPSRRSIVAADIETNNAAVTSGMTSSSKRRSRTTNSAMTGARRLPVGQPAPPSKTPAPPPPAHTEAAAGRGAGRASASTPPSAPYGRGCGATPWWRTTHRGSCPSPPCSRARTASRSSWSPHVAGPSSVPSTRAYRPQPRPPLECAPLRAHSSVSQRPPSRAHI